MARRASSDVIAATLLVGISIASAAGVAALIPRLAQSQGSNAAIIVGSVTLRQGAIGILALQLTNTGRYPITSYALKMYNLQGASGTFTATLTVTDSSTGALLYSGSTSVSPASFLLSFSPGSATPPGTSLRTTIVVTAGTQGQALYQAGNPYTLSVSTQTSQGGAQAIQSVVATSM